MTTRLAEKCGPLCIKLYTCVHLIGNIIMYNVRYIMKHTVQFIENYVQILKKK